MIGAATEFVIVDLHAGVVRDTRVVRDVGDTPLAFAFTPDGRAIAVAGDYSPILIVDVATGTIRRRLAGHKNWFIREFRGRPPGS